MKQDVFPQKEVAGFLSKNFIPVVLDIDDDMLPEGFVYYAVPTFFVASEKGILVERVVGGADKQQFLEYLRNVLKKNSLSK